MEKRRVVVTGLGLISPVGVGVDASWAAILEGKSGVRRITKFDPTNYACQIAAEVRGADEEGGFNPDNYLDKKEQKKMDTFIQYGVAAADEAVKMAGLSDVSDEDLKNRIGVVLGSGIGGLPEIERQHAVLQEKGPRRVSPFFIPSILINLFAGHVSMRYGFRGPNSSTVTACATAAHGIGTGKRMIEMNEADVIVAGGAEACICPTAIAGFGSSKALATDFNDNPEASSRPFDEARSGFVMGEGAGVLVLEEYEHAKKRGATIYAELAGFGQSGDAYHMTMPHPDGLGCRLAMEAALKDAAVSAEDVNYVNGHSTSTPAGDVLESKAIETLLGENTVVSATKSMTGHALGAAGGLEAVFSVMALKEGMLPPTINLENVSEGCNLDYVSDGARAQQENYALSNSFGFGGTNASLLFKRF